MVLDLGHHSEKVIQDLIVMNQKRRTATVIIDQKNL